MISFYPGPSRVYENIPSYVKEAYDQGIMSINHRSNAFMQLMERTLSLMKKKLEIPDDYTILFTSSATECWEIIAQSLIEKHSYHFFNGAFGEKWFDYTKKLKPSAIGYQFNLQKKLKIGELDLSSTPGTICITQNETANGTYVSNGMIARIRKQYPNHLIAVDATSSMGGIHLEFSYADVWYASVQKCFGLPAGMGIMICSPAAVEKAMEINESKHYNSLNFMLKNMKKLQTPYTPNVLNIFLLMKVMDKIKPVKKLEKKLEKRQESYISCFENSKKFNVLINNKAVRSSTVLTISGAEADVQAIKTEAERNGLLLGNGYGQHKNTTFRIANFPALKKNEVKTLENFLREYLKD